MHQIGRPLTKKNEKLVFIYLFLYPNWILFPFVRNIQFALRVHSAKRKIIIISLDCTNNLLFRFIDPVPSKRDCIHSTNENEYSAQMRRKPISRRSSSFILTLCCSFFVSYANPFYEVNRVIHTALLAIRWRGKSQLYLLLYDEQSTYQYQLLRTWTCM